MSAPPKDHITINTAFAGWLISIVATSIGCVLGSIAIVAFLFGMVLGWKAAGAPEPKPPTPIVVCDEECAP